MALLDKQSFLVVYGTLVKTSLMRLKFMLRCCSIHVSLLKISISTILSSKYVLVWFTVD